MFPEIVFLDLDGTLLNHRKEVDERDRTALCELHRCGTKIGYLTSRTERKLSSLLEGLPCDFIGSVNGAVIRIYENGIPVWNQVSGIAWNSGLRLLHACESVSAEHVSAIFSPCQLWDGMISCGGQTLGQFADVVKNLTPVRFQRIRLYAPQKMPDVDLSSYRVTNEGRDILIETPQVDKGYAVQSVLSYYGMAKDMAACFGDEAADLSMFRACSVSIAPANAAQEVLTEATERTCDNDNACVAHWLETALGISVKPHLEGSVKSNDCFYLLKDITSTCTKVAASEKKEMLKKGMPAASILAEDPPVTAEENRLFLELLDQNAPGVAKNVGVLAESILEHKQEFPVLVSLVRGGVVYGTLCRRYYRKIYHREVPHYAVSLVRGHGIDENAMDYIVRRHGDHAIQFIDGWTGSGFLCSELRKYIEQYNVRHGTHISPELGVLADTSGVCLLSGTREDIMLPDCCLNATVCGLISSVCIAPDVVGAEDFHGAAVWRELSPTDYSNYYIETISSLLSRQLPKREMERQNAAQALTEELVATFALNDRKKVRLGIGESTRALFRSETDCLLVGSKADSRLQFLYTMAEERSIPVRVFPLGKYACAAILA